MNHQTSVIIASLMAAFGGSQALASRPCQTGPECQQLQSAINALKELKAKRHQDVVQYGRDSTEVKQDDQAIQDATSKDHEIRSERRKDLPKEVKHSRQFRRQKRWKS